LLREKREEVYKFISEQLKKEYIKSSKSPQIALVFFVGKKDRKKHIAKIEEDRLSFFFIFFLILFFFQFIFHFSIFRTLELGLEVISHTITSVTSNSVVTALIMGLERRK